MRRTKIVCTIGPSSSPPEVLRTLIATGLDVARLNLSHGTHDSHRAMFETIRRLAADVGHNVAILVDLQGPRIRTGSLRNGTPVRLVEGGRICLTAREVEGDAECVGTTYAALPRDVHAGDRILIADGTMELRVEDVAPPDVHCRTVRGGMLGEHKGMNLPGVTVSAPSLTEKDEADLALAMELGADYVALSFVRTADDIRLIKSRIETLRKPGQAAPGVVAKIERPEAVANFADIVGVTDAVMVARGDLGIEMPIEDVPQLQKALIRQCHEHGVPVITATQMLESMTEHPSPTRAEATDVANAIYDGTDAVMLSGETASGRFPIEAVRIMAAIAEKADAALEDILRPPHDGPSAVGGEGVIPRALAQAVHDVAHALHPARIVCFTRSGFTARAVARYRPQTPITALALDDAVVRRCALLWGVDALRSPEVAHLGELAPTVDLLLRGKGLAGTGDTILLVSGSPLAAGGETNMLNIHVVGSA